MNEFDLIKSIFAPLATAEGAFGLVDDAAVVKAPSGLDLVYTKDVLISGVHFPESTSPENIARKLLRVNLSDLAAMGALPSGYMLGCQFTGAEDEVWLNAFAGGLKMDQETFGIALLGGDTTKTPGPLALSLTAIGHVPTGQALLRSGAQSGDDVWVSGSIGDGACGLMVAKGAADGLSVEDSQYLRTRLDLPTPRLELGYKLRAIATAAVDVSDGLAADLGHVAQASNLRITVEAEKVPISKASKMLLNRGVATLEALLSGGDDYELAFTAPEGQRDEVEQTARDLGLPLTRIGSAVAGVAGVRFEQAGKVLNLSCAGYEHL